MLLKLPKWILTDKFPAFHDTESLTVIEQTARIHGKVNEIVDSYNTFAENVNKTLEEWAKSDHEEEEAFRIALRQEFQDFIDVVDIKVNELEHFAKVNLSGEIRNLLQEIKETGELSEDILTTFTDILSEVQEIRTDNEAFKTTIEGEFTAHQEAVHNANTEFMASVDESVTALSTTVNTNTEYLTDKINKHYNNEFAPLSETVNNHSEQLEVIHSVLDNKNVVVFNDPNKEIDLGMADIYEIEIGEEILNTNHANVVINYNNHRYPAIPCSVTKYTDSFNILGCTPSTYGNLTNNEWDLFMVSLVGSIVDGKPIINKCYMRRTRFGVDNTATTDNFVTAFVDSIIAVF